jgi:hypothetical protein
MKLDEMEEALAERTAKDATNKAMAQRWLGNHNSGRPPMNGSISDGWSYPCRNNCHSHCQSGINGTCKCPCHDDEWCGAGSC